MKTASEAIPPLEARNIDLVDKKIIINHLKLTSNFNTPAKFVHSNNKRFFNVKKGSTSAIERGNFSKRHFPVFARKNATYQNCVHKGHFKKLVNPHKKCKHCK